MGLRNLADVREAVAIRGGSWGLETSITSVLQEEDLGNYSLSLMSIPEKVMEQIILQTISKHIKDKKAVAVIGMDLGKGNHTGLS